jgi:hypothetical protein
LGFGSGAGFGSAAGLGSGVGLGSAAILGAAVGVTIATDWEWVAVVSTAWAVSMGFGAT